MSRRDIYYWKCDRPAAFHGTQARGVADVAMEQQLRDSIKLALNATEVKLSPGAGQGNHLNWNAEVDGVALFVRVENGPEKDGQLAVESAVLDAVRHSGVPTPRVLACDASRQVVPFAWQALERVPFPDLNHWFKSGELAHRSVAFAIGEAVARWQGVKVGGFGPLELADGGELVGPHGRYADYFWLRLRQHLSFLLERGFISEAEGTEMLSVVEQNEWLLNLDQSVLVHKDLALWNILGSRDRIAAFIDFDDAIGGDPMDDLSLLGCFHDAAFVRQAVEGYSSLRPLPPDCIQRFWLHLLRNMIVKAVIRVGAGYFERSSNFFLIGAGGSGGDLRRFTRQRLELAVRGLRDGLGLEHL